jgi:hypothetical protein
MNNKQLARMPTAGSQLSCNSQTDDEGKLKNEEELYD